MSGVTPGQVPDWRGIADELAEAIRLTREYVEPKVNLPAIPGWSWYDAVTRYREATQAATAGPEPQPAPELAAYEADIASLTDQRNRVSDTADRLRMQVRNLRDALERCRDSAGRSPAAVHTIASQALASSQEDGQ